MASHNVNFLRPNLHNRNSPVTDNLLDLIFCVHDPLVTVPNIGLRLIALSYQVGNIAEQLLIGQCAYKAFLAMSKVCGALWLIFTLSALFLGTGLLPILAVCLIWGTGQIAYSYWTLRLDRPGTELL